jgi:uncharacterized protein
MIEQVQNKLETLAKLCANYQVTRLELFGSAATDSFDAKKSDIDFLVKFEKLSPKEHADAYFGLLASLQDLFGISIDLLEAGAVRNPFLLESIDESRTTLYAA